MTDVQNPKIIDGTFVFKKAAQEAALFALYQQMFDQDIPPKGQLYKAIKTVNSINFQALSPEGKQTFQSLCGRLHEMEVNEHVNKIFDSTQKLIKSGVKNFKTKQVNSLEKKIIQFSNDYRGLSDVNIKLLEGAWRVLKRVKLAIDLLQFAGWMYMQKEITKEMLRQASVFSEKMGLPCINEKSCLEEVENCIQTAVIKSFQIVRNDGYIPPKEEILKILEQGAPLSLYKKSQ